MTETLLPEKAQTNTLGEVAIKHIQPRRALIEIIGVPKYVTTVRANISMTWVQPDDLTTVLSKMGGCCGKKKQHQFQLANAADVRQWTNGGGR